MYRWALSLVLFASVGAVYAEEYAIFKIQENQDGDPIKIFYIGEFYLKPEPVVKSLLEDPPKNEKWLFWDASSVGFKMGVPTLDFSSQYTATASIEAAIDSWDDLEADSLSITYDGEDLFETNDPDDGENIIFWSTHSSVSGGNGFTLITAPTSGAEVGEFSDVDIVLNDGKRWTTNSARCGTDTVDVQSVVTHEVGHALGLGHATAMNAMTSSSGTDGWCEDHESDYEDPNLKQRVVTANDEDGYNYIYVNANSIRSRHGGGAGLKRVANNQGAQSQSNEVVVFPNPFNPEVTVSFQLEQSSHVVMGVYDLLGRRVRSLVNEPVQSAGYFQQIWDGRDNDGRQVASGLYFLAVDINGVIETRKLTLIR